MTALLAIRAGRARAPSSHDALSEAALEVRERVLCGLVVGLVSMVLLVGAAAGWMGWFFGVGGAPLGSTLAISGAAPGVFAVVWGAGTMIEPARRLVAASRGDAAALDTIGLHLLIGGALTVMLGFLPTVVGSLVITVLMGIVAGL